MFLFFFFNVATKRLIIDGESIVRYQRGCGFETEYKNSFLYGDYLWTCDCGKEVERYTMPDRKYFIRVEDFSRDGEFWFGVTSGICRHCGRQLYERTRNLRTY